MLPSGVYTTRNTIMTHQSYLDMPRQRLKTQSLTLIQRSEQEQGSSFQASPQGSLDFLYSAFPHFAAAYAASSVTATDQAAEDSMSDDTHALLAGPSRPTYDVVLTGSCDSMDRT